MERYTNHLIVSDYGRAVTTHSSNEVWDEMVMPDLDKIIKRIEGLDDMITDLYLDGEFDNGVGKQKLLYESLEDIRALALVLVDETKRLNDDYDGTLCIMDGMREERYTMCNVIDTLAEENDALKSHLEKAAKEINRLSKENAEYKNKITAINAFLDGYKARIRRN